MLRLRDAPIFSQLRSISMRSCQAVRATFMRTEARLRMHLLLFHIR